MPEIYQQIADKDTFDIFMKNIKEMLTPQSEGQQSSTSNKKKKKKPQEIEEIVEACLEIIEQYMDHEPQHLRNYLTS